MKDQIQIKILQLYPKDRNIYGDMGNLLLLENMLKNAGLEPVIISHNPGDSLPENIDIAIGGGGQDSGQEKVQEDLLQISPRLKQWADAGVPMLMICGLYQLFGNFFKTLDGKIIEGAGILNIETHGSKDRLIGNIITESAEFGEIIGYENHSGQTRLLEGTQPLAQVTKGEGNNLQDNHEGARYKNVIGSYLHGSLLPKNPRLTDFLIEIAWTQKYPDQPLPQLEHPEIDQVTDLARKTALSRPR